MKTFTRLHSKFLFGILFLALLPFGVKAQWTAPVNITPHSLGARMNENMGQCIVASTDTLHVVWTDKRTHGYALYYRRSIDSGSTWGPETLLTDTTDKAEMPSIAVNGRNLHVVWLDSVKGNPASFYMHSTDGGNTWSKPLCIDSNTTFWPGIAVNTTTVFFSINKAYAPGNSEVFLCRSFDNGNTWGPEIRISNAAGRSEDQAMIAQGNSIQLDWNDDRSGTMQTYYRRSPDNGATWEPETALITLGSAYSPAMAFDSARSYALNANSSKGFTSWFLISQDSGKTWGAPSEINPTPQDSSGGYPYMIAHGKDLFVIYVDLTKYIMYMHSGDGGLTWDPNYMLCSFNKNPAFNSGFIALTCPTLHAIWLQGPNMYYSKNPTAVSSCSSPTGINVVSNNPAGISIYPNPATNSTIVSFLTKEGRTVELYDITGRKVSTVATYSAEYRLDCNNLSPGIYFIKVSTSKGTETRKLVKE